MSGKNVPGQHFEQLQGPATQADTAAAERSVLSKVSGKFKGAVLALCAAGNLAACDTPNAPVAELANPKPAASASETPTASTTTEKKESAETTEKQQINKLYQELTGKKTHIPRVGEESVSDTTAYLTVLDNGNMVVGMSNETFTAKGITTKEVHGTSTEAPKSENTNAFLEQLAKDADNNNFGVVEFEGKRFAVIPKGFNLKEHYGDRKVYVEGAVDKKAQHFADLDYTVESDIRTGKSTLILKVTPQVYLSHGFPVNINGGEVRINAQPGTTKTHTVDMKGDTEISFAGGYDVFNPATNQSFSSDGKLLNGEKANYDNETIPAVSWSSVANELKKHK